MSLEFRADRNLIRAQGRSTRYLLARIEAPASPQRSARLPVSIAFVLDRSGSMDGEKIHLAREAVLTAIRGLRDHDRFSVVVYDNEVDLLVPSTAATPAARREAEAIVRRVEARGMTDLAGGWLAGCEQLAEGLHADTVGRCLLLTDGLANVGITDHDELVGHARELAARGIATTTFGVGRDFDERLLADMAHAGRGNYYYIESARQIPDFIASEVGEALEVVARDVRLDVEAPADVHVNPLNDLETTRDGHRVTIAVGTLVSQQVLDVVLKVDFPRGLEGAVQLLAGALHDLDGALAGAAANSVFTYASHARNDAQGRDLVVDREVAALYAARARAQALDLNAEGRYAEAQAVLQATARRIAAYAAGDAVLRGIVRELESVDESYGGLMSPDVRKTQHMQWRSAMQGRDLSGKAKRGYDPNEKA